ncbi:DUF2189 domain-containing protein [Erythrobacter sp. F6033]|uniref:DUF2189 domain-containing protein n=1 Tax=Erythrobacter sp. F6033 TaxID=2926401 RepID=UPI001FF57374|nr:DUF2189 domain-containing protein [Erythrobacter sp. F6033]MCK0127558.1 DUF2189 domain-containing protein [Erythrobacter sp. F6033]
MADIGSNSPVPFKVAGDLTISDLRAALAAGWSDFLAMPQYGLFFGAIFAFAGIALAYATIVLGEVSWLIPAAAGFPLLAPFLAVGLYEVSRRREYGIAVDWPAVLGAIRGRGHDQILSMGVLIFVGFGFWVIIAHLIFSVFLVEAGAGSESLEFLITPMGLAMLAVGSLIGGVIALVFYAVTVISLPMLVDREVDFLTAIFASLRAVSNNSMALLIWAVFIAIIMALAIALAFLGLLIVVPVLGHATWHLYRRTIASTHPSTGQVV